MVVEHLKIGGVRIAEPCANRVVIGRIYTTFPSTAPLKNAVLTVATVLNNPFHWSAVDKFFKKIHSMKYNPRQLQHLRYVARNPQTLDWLSHI